MALPVMEQPTLAADLSQKSLSPLANFVTVVPCSGSFPNKNAKVGLASCLV
jgi:hypothetical protein